MHKAKMGLLLFLALLLAQPVFTLPALAEVIPGELTREGLAFQSVYPSPEAVPGQSPTTGLPWDGVYTPVLVVLDNAPEAYPHWGVGAADVFFQVPNASGGATKILALFSDSFPEQAGGSRSARPPFISMAREWGAVIAYAGDANLPRGNRASVQDYLADAGMRQRVKAFNLLHKNDYSGRISGYVSPHNLSVKIKTIRDLALAKGAAFPVPRAFRFADVPLLAGVPVQEFTVAHHGHRREKGLGNEASFSRFVYQPGLNAYWREHSRGWDTDRDAGDTPLAFANVIVQRVKFSYSGQYVLLESLDGTGAADIFTGGKYIRGGWFRQDADSRTVFVDENGQEIALQRGKTFIILTNDITEVSLVRP